MIPLVLSALGLCIVICVVSFVKGNRQQRVVATVTGTGLVALGVLVTATLSRSGDPALASAAYGHVAGRKVGRFLCAQYPGARMLVLTAPKGSMPDSEIEYHASLVQGLRVEARGKMELVRVLSLDGTCVADGRHSQQGIGSMHPNATPLLTPQNLEKILAPYAGSYDLVVTTLSLQPSASGSSDWDSSSPPKLVLLCSQVTGLRKMIEDRHVVGAVVFHPHYVLWPLKPPSDLDLAFNKRYLLITPGNVAEVAGLYPFLFDNGRPPTGGGVIPSNDK